MIYAITHQHRHSPDQHAQSSPQCSAEHQPCAQSEQRPGNEADGGEDVHTGEGYRAQRGVVFDPLEEGLEGIIDEAKTRNLWVGAVGGGAEENETKRQTKQKAVSFFWTCQFTARCVHTATGEIT